MRRVLITVTVLIFTYAFIACGERALLKPLPADAVILAFGDSLTVGFGVKPQQSYPAILEQETGYTVINAGVSGEVTALGVKRLPTLLREHRPDLVIICHGGNDILKKLSMEEAESNIRQMVKESKDIGADVVLISVPKFGIWMAPPELYERIAEEFSVPIQPNILCELERNRDMKSDLIHLNEVGYRKLAEAVLSVLQEEGAL
jgi:lysophospholipase L1-like esterase